VTATVNVAPAHAARRLVKTERLCREITERLPEMPKDMLAALAIVVVGEVERRRGVR